MNNDQQIDDLNAKVKIRLAPSPIHGVGVFAIRDIAAGQQLYAGHTAQVYTLPFARFDELFPEVKQIILERWPWVVVGGKFAYPDTYVQAFMNHSDDPNYDGQTDTLLKDVKTGDEITENYRVIPGSKTAHPWLYKD